MAAQRRDKGTGSVYFEHKTGTEHNPKGGRGDQDNTKFHRGCTGRWRGTLDLGRNGAGKRIRKPVTASTREALLEKLGAARDESESTVQIDKRITVAQALDALLANKLADGIAPSTVKSDSYNVKLINAQIGEVKLHELTAQQFKAALQRIAQSKTTGQMRKIKGLMAHAIQLVQEDDKLERNVAGIVTVPKGKKASLKRKAHSTEEVRAILAASIGYRNMDAGIHLGFGLGPRPDEIVGLQWTEVDLTPGEERVYFTKTARHSGRTKGETEESLGSRRGVALPQEVADAFRRHRVIQNQERLRAGAQWRETGHVFTTKTGGPIMSQYFRTAYLAVLAKAGIPLADPDGTRRVPYDMRHTFASHATEEEERDKVAQMMGHKRVATLELVYRDDIKPVIQGTRDLGLYRSSGTG